MELSQIRAFAAKAHENDRYGDQPYTVHLDAVVAVLREFGHTDPLTLAVGYLHDTVEDTPTTILDILRLTGSTLIAQAVRFLTDEDGPDRATRKLLTYSRCKVCEGEYARVGRVVKWADRIANLRESVRSGNERMLRLYRKEDAAFREAYTPRTPIVGLDPMVEEYANLIGN